MYCTFSEMHQGKWGCSLLQIQVIRVFIVCRELKCNDKTNTNASMFFITYTYTVHLQF